jgi:hypothetical protein
MQALEQAWNAMPELSGPWRMPAETEKQLNQGVMFSFVTEVC